MDERGREKRQQRKGVGAKLEQRGREWRTQMGLPLEFLVSSWRED